MGLCETLPPFPQKYKREKERKRVGPLAAPAGWHTPAGFSWLRQVAMQRLCLTLDTFTGCFNLEIITLAEAPLLQLFPLL